MEIDEKILSSTEVAKLCGVSRGTINYWILNKKLYAKRSVRNYSIPVKDLLLFLKSSRREIPHELQNNNFERPIFRSSQHCWEYWKGNNHANGCENCVVLTNKLDICFTANESSRFHCDTRCNECQYYIKTYLPRLQIIHQIEFPAAIYKDLYLWGGNKNFAELCEVQERDLPGMGIEQIVHPDSLAMVISNIKNRALGDPKVPSAYSIFINNTKCGKLKVNISVYPLKDPFKAKLVLMETENS